MPGLAMNAMNGESGVEEPNNAFYTPYKDSLSQERSPRSALSPQSQHSDSIDLAIDGVVETSIEQFYHNVYEIDKKFVKKKNKNQIQGVKYHSRLQLDFEASVKSSPKSKSSQEKTLVQKRYQKNSRKLNAAFLLRKQRNFTLLGAKFQNGTGDSLEAGFENPDLGPFCSNKQGI
ncbi:hypothetical protein CRYUN_Cryun24cG0063100 [Craigia yunnanensis]